MRDRGYGASASGSVPVLTLELSPVLTVRAYPRRDGQAELTWVAGYIAKCRRSQSTND